MHLTSKSVQELRKKRGRYRDDEVRGLTLQIGDHPGNASWVLRFQRHGKERWFGLGPLQLIDLKAARQKARAARQLLLDGIDPLEKKKSDKAATALAAAKAMTFEEAVQEYFDQHKAEWTNAKHSKQFLTSLETHAFPKIGKLLVSKIDTGCVLSVVEPIWGTKTTTADRVRARIEAVLAWCTVRNYRSGDNPAQWRNHLDQALPARAKIQPAKNHAALDYHKIPAFMSELRERQGVVARALEFLILCASRTNEVVGAQWDEIDFNGKMWIIPAERMKARREHRVALSDRAVEILRSLPREADNNYVFIGARRASISGIAMWWLLKGMGHGEVTVHGMRAVFRTWAAECTAYPVHVLEQSLAHQTGTQVERAYNRSDLIMKRLKLMQDWSRYCQKPVGQAGNVTTLRARR